MLQKITESLTAEWDRAHQNIESVDRDNLLHYRDVLFNLRFGLMTKIENLDDQIANLSVYDNGNKYGLSNARWDIQRQLIPVNSDYGLVLTTIATRGQQ